MKTILESYELFLEAIPIISGTYDDLKFADRKLFVDAINRDYYIEIEAASF